MASATERPVTIIAAPCNLGLRPLRKGHEPGTWKAPDTLLSAGLAEVLGAEQVVRLPRPVYSPDPQPGTRLLNGNAIREYCLQVADAVGDVLARRQRPVVVGGDCAVLLGALAAVRQSGPVSLVHIDGHSDFRHPGNYDPSQMLGAVAGMDLALATGRGEALLAEWPGVHGPLVPDADVLQLGARESGDPDYAWADVEDTLINRITIFDALRMGTAAVIGRIDDFLAQKPEQPFWLHLDVDVLDERVMPAVDSPGHPGLEPEALAQTLAHLAVKSGCLGATLTIFDPELDPDGRYAALIVRLAGQLASDRQDF